MLIEYEDGTPFANGGTEYNTLPERDLSDQVVIFVELGGRTEGIPMFEAVVHTTIPYLVCHPDIAESMGLNDVPPDVARAGVVIEGKLIEGRIYRGAVLTLLADKDKGENVQQVVWAFVPDSGEDLTRKDFPKIYLGMKHCLERFVFAVDPFSRVFYFGGEVAV